MRAVSLDGQFPPSWTASVRGDLTWIVCEALGRAGVRIVSARRLTGGAIHENWRLDLEGTASPLVLRKSGRSTIPESQPRAWEYAVQAAAHAAGVRTPRPLLLCEDTGLLGSAFFLMEWASGTARPGEILAGEDTAGLAAELGAQLALIHSVAPPPGDGRIGGNAPDDAIARYRGYLDRHARPHPVLEWGLRWLEINAPAVETVLVHGDFRTGNYLVREGRLAAVLDWEFAGLSDPHADLGWFCAKCWRYERYDREAGGLASREVFYGAYQQAGGRRVDRELVAYWEVMAHVRWGIIALQQADRHLSGRECALELALLGRRLAELEHEILEMTGGHA